MFPKCPKCGLALGEAASAESCPGCGLIFRKYLEAKSGAPIPRPAGKAPLPATAEEAAEEEPSLKAWLKHWFLYVPDEVETWRVYTGAALLAASLFFGWRYYFMDIPSWEMSSTFLHIAMLPFHEFGHILFRPFGEFMTLMGGSLAQWLMPLAFLWLFAFKNRDSFTASLMLWWMGTQWIDLAPYAYDAAAPQHILLTGRTGDTGGHDYIDTLFDLGLLKRAHEVGWVMHKFGLLVMLAAWAWGGYILWRQFKNRAAS